MSIRVVHIATSDLSGGAARAAYRQHAALRESGRVHSRMLAMIKLSDDPDVIAYDYARGIIGRLIRGIRQGRLAAEGRRAYRNRPGGYELFSDDRSEQGSGAFYQLPTCDLVNLHWIDGFVPFADVFRRFKGNRPVVWTLHDMVSVTGGCHYDAGCNRYQTACGRCPQLGSCHEHDFAHAVWRRKQAVINQWGLAGLKVVATTNWLKDRVVASALFRDADVRLIPHGVDSRCYSPGDRGLARRRFGLPLETVVIAFMATGAQLPRKGYTCLREAVEGLAGGSGLVLFTVGGDSPASPVGIRHIHLKHAAADEEVIDVYRAADLFVMPSLQEAYGLTGQEAMACGIPLVGFRTGMCADAVEQGISGYVVDVGDVAGLRDAIAALIGDAGKRERMGAAAREYVCANLTYEHNAQRYADLYEECLNRRPGVG